MPKSDFSKKRVALGIGLIIVGLTALGGTLWTFTGRHLLLFIVGLGTSWAFIMIGSFVMVSVRPSETGKYFEPDHGNDVIENATGRDLYRHTIKVRVLSLIFLCFVPAVAVIITFLVKGPEFFTMFGISTSDGLLLSAFALVPSSLIFALLWQHYALNVAFPPMNQAFLHPRHIVKIWSMKLFLALEGLSALLMYSHYQNSLAGLMSVSVTAASMYGFMIVSEIGVHMTKDPRVWRPFRY
jgi:hypothetical protein